MNLSDLTTDIVARGIYLDFEGFQEGDPVFAGWYVDGVFRQVVFDRRLESAATAKGLPIDDMHEWATMLADQARQELRMTLAFSTREIDVLKGVLGVLPDEVYGNLLPVAKQWRSRLYPVEQERVQRARDKLKAAGKYVGAYGKKLTDYWSLARIDVPTNYGTDKTTKRLRYAIEKLERYGSYSEIPRGAKRAWTNVLAHNRFDCEGLATLAQKILSDARERKARP